MVVCVKMMSKGALTVLIVTHVERVERSLNMFSSNAMYVKGVESYFDFWPLQHASTYIALDGMVGKA